MTSVLEKLQAFVEEHRFARSKGALNVGLVMTRRAREKGLPLDPAAQLSPSGGQVAGLNGDAGNRILRDYGVTRSMGTEVGRTNRGSIDNMRRYVAFLNELGAEGVNLEEVERFWVDLFRARFASAPFKFRGEIGVSIESVVRDLLSQAESRQREMSGAMIVGTMLQHLVGAKLEEVLGDRVTVIHHSANTNDAGHGRGGDFDIGDAAIHVTATPSEALIRKCTANVQAGVRPIIVTTPKGMPLAEGLSAVVGVRDRIEILEIGQFLSANAHELGLFAARGATAALERIVDRYNNIIDTCENDPSLRIAR
ncbi:MAG: DUF4928 family protein [Pseudomonadota bacterium]|uniref:DUF4928 family protein n=1 Tax=Sphingobium sp. TaxID=1912891 RepID=UPI002E22B96B